MTPAIGERRQRQGRCERCDQPLTDEVWVETCRCGCGRAMWRADLHSPGLCCGPIACVSPIDWRARALAAEQALADAQGMEGRDVLSAMMRVVKERDEALARAIPKAWVETDTQCELHHWNKDDRVETNVFWGQLGIEVVTWKNGESARTTYPTLRDALDAAAKESP